MPRRTRVSEEELKQTIKLYDEGLSWKEIEEKLGRPWKALSGAYYRWKRQQEGEASDQKGDEEKAENVPVEEKTEKSEEDETDEGEKATEPTKPVQEPSEPIIRKPKKVKRRKHAKTASTETSSTDSSRGEKGERGEKKFSLSSPLVWLGLAAGAAGLLWFIFKTRKNKVEKASATEGQVERKELDPIKALEEKYRVI